MTLIFEITAGIILALLLVAFLKRSLEIAADTFVQFRSPSTATIACLFTGAALMFSVSLHSEDYHIGTISMRLGRYGSSTTITANGQTTSIFCNAAGSHVNCTDDPGEYKVMLDNGTTVISYPPDHHVSQCDDACDPLDEIFLRVAPGKPKKFQYHLLVADDEVSKKKTPFYCVDFTVTDEDGKEKPQMACYPIYVATSPDKTLLAPNEDGVLVPKDISSPYHMTAPKTQFYEKKGK
jgi:hypothetical protein